MHLLRRGGVIALQGMDLTPSSADSSFSHFLLVTATMFRNSHHLREEIREENQQAFAYIFSDAVGLGLFVGLLYFNPRSVSIMQLTGSRIFTNISDTGKAFVIILCSDIFLGYEHRILLQSLHPCTASFSPFFAPTPSLGMKTTISFSSCTLCSHSDPCLSLVLFSVLVLAAPCCWRLMSLAADD